MTEPTSEQKKAFDQLLAACKMAYDKPMSKAVSAALVAAINKAEACLPPRPRASRGRKQMKTKAKTPGRRIPEPPHSWNEGECPISPGDYWKAADGSWYGVTPTGLHVWLKNHHVAENEDGTIDVVSGPWGSNSILVNGDRPNAWHGAIQRGVWI